MKIKLDSVFNLEPKEAVAFFSDKGLKPTFAWQDMIGQEHDTAFTVAKMMDTDLLEATQGMLKQALKNGDSFEQFKRGLVPGLVEKGWWGRAEIADPLTGIVSEVQLGSASRLETIFRTNMQSAYSAGKWEQIERNATTAPYLMYDAVDDGRTREEHARFDGLVLKWDHPFWKTHYPPNGWNCRCGVIQLSEAEVKAMGKSTNDKAPPLKKSKWENPRTGKTHDILEGLDPGWNHNPGVERVEALKKVYKEKLNALPPELKPAAIKGDLLIEKVDTIEKAIEVGDIRLKEVISEIKTPEFIKKLEDSISRLVLPDSFSQPADIAVMDELRVAILKRLEKVVGTKEVIKNIDGSAQAKKVLQRASAKLPNTWTSASEADGSMLFASFTNSLTKRASFSPLDRPGRYKLGGRVVVAKEGDGYLMTKPTSTTEHEFLHRIQNKLPALDQLFQDLHKKRTAGDPQEVIYAGTREVGRKDGYYNAYQGREYYANNGALEVMTMALQPILGGDPKKLTPQDAQSLAKMYNEDKEMLVFALGVLFGWRP